MHCSSGVEGYDSRDGLAAVREGTESVRVKVVSENGAASALLTLPRTEPITPIFAAAQGIGASAAGTGGEEESSSDSESSSDDSSDEDLEDMSEEEESEAEESEAEESNEESNEESD